jgi:predicted RNase H-like nuclease (RuvC/YqgF family)
MRDQIKELRAELDDAKEIGNQLIIEAVAKGAEIKRLQAVIEALNTSLRTAAAEVERLRAEIELVSK